MVEAALTARNLGISAPLVSAQNYYNLLDRGVEADLSVVCERYGLGILPYFPLAMGLLAGRYRRGETVPSYSRLDLWGWQAYLTDERFDVAEKLEAYAAERSVTILDVAIAGLAAQPAVASVIAGASSARPGSGECPSG